ncbi:hypothetical protein BmR1_04g06200 [Babesia microti strain RI]|uniref:30S ribosomal protein S15 n=1 Tax=Babesia microti (strain RI) TaxID=1133968 RepID=I7IH98_BABMR|nr:hypothetical protein BmR1_04g06200 [Babesia microti strain RI]CCF75437.1 hypothetical protein BmR1_04g06200 [Babesia microti strain RI]|eukprot:XP_012649845.1 hypothetical protein BmR1_04g06200 [Babesia microti strain RI]
MQVKGYFLLFLANPLRHQINNSKGTEFRESTATYIGENHITRNNTLNCLTKAYSTSKNVFSTSEEGERELNISGDTPLSDLYTNPGINFYEFDAIDSSDSCSYNPNFIPDSDVSSPNIQAYTHDISQTKSHLPDVSPSSKSVGPITKRPAPIDSNIISTAKGDKPLPTEEKKDTSENKKKILTGPGKGLFAKQIKCIVQDKLPHLYSARTNFVKPQNQQISHTEIAVESRTPKKLLKSAKSRVFPATELKNSPRDTSDIKLSQEAPSTSTIKKGTTYPKTTSQSIISEFNNTSVIHSDFGGEIVNDFYDTTQTVSKKEHISTSSTWDISPSQLRVKGAYFIQRYVQELREPFKRHEKDTGSCDTQVAAITARIDYLIEHVKRSPKDISAKLKLLKLAHRRRKHLAYLFKTNKQSFQRLIDTFKLYFDTKPYTYEKVLPDYVYRRRNSTKREYTKEGRSKPFISSPARFDNITLDMLIR